MIKIGKNKITLDREVKGIAEIAINDLPMYLGEHVEIEEGVTFKRIFELLIMNRKIFNIVFYSFTRGHDIDLYINDFLKEPDEEDSDVEYYEVYRVFEHMIFDDGEVNHEYYYGIHGVGQPDEHGITNYSLSFTSLSEMKKKPIKVNNLLDITIDTGINLRKEKDAKLEDKFKSLHKAQIPITLFNFIGAILNEITFFGSPKKRKEFSDGLEKQSKEIDEAIARGEEVGYPVDWDENGDVYLLKDGKKDYFLGKKDDEKI